MGGAVTDEEYEAEPRVAAAFRLARAVVACAAAWRAWEAAGCPGAELLAPDEADPLRAACWATAEERDEAEAGVLEVWGAP